MIKHRVSWIDATLYQERILDYLIRICQETKHIQADMLDKVWDLQNSGDPFIKKVLTHTFSHLSSLENLTVEDAC